uniref:Uncharacterized protein n=1 Tax=Romanomermis culicivorax TaxID=13658 RepID=A0A915K5P1_ROMCU
HSFWSKLSQVDDIVLINCDIQLTISHFQSHCHSVRRSTMRNIGHRFGVALRPQLVIVTDRRRRRASGSPHTEFSQTDELRAKIFPQFGVQRQIDERRHAGMLINVKFDRSLSIKNAKSSKL